MKSDSLEFLKPWTPGALERWWWIVRCHRPGQLVGRAARLSGRWAGRELGGWIGKRHEPTVIAPPRVREGTTLVDLLERKLADRSSDESTDQARRIATGRFCFLHQELVLGHPFDPKETAGRVSHLWRFHLHYHEFLLDLAAEYRRTGRREWLDRGWDLVEQWIDAAAAAGDWARDDAWHPYCISRRLPAWMLFWSAGPPDETRRGRVLASMAAQAEWLRRHVERELGGNHLLENAAALAMAGVLFEGPAARRWLDKGEQILRRELARQILPHGEHEERSPMYHARLLECLLDVRDAAAALRPELARFCQENADRMAGFLAAILHPDENIPLLGDSCLAATPPPAALIARVGGTMGGCIENEPSNVGQSVNLPKMAGWQPAPRARKAGWQPAPRAGKAGWQPAPRAVGPYWIFRHEDDFLLFDAGPVGPDHLPAHAHGDLLGIEASVAGRRLLVDAGAYCYEDDAMRQYCRSSAAHNVLRMDDQDQCDTWSRFRMGYRGWPRDFTSGKHGDFWWARAEHDAYRRLGVPRVGRRLACRPGGPWYCMDWASGLGRHRLTTTLRFHPDVEIKPMAEDRLRIRHGETVLCLRWLTPGRTRLTRGWYCPEFGLRRECPVAEWTTTTGLPACCGWSLSWEK
jgi:hypothetical protein